MNIRQALSGKKVTKVGDINVVFCFIRYNTRIVYELRCQIFVAFK